MNKAPKASRASKVLIFGLLCNFIDIFDKDKIKERAFVKGYNLSQTFKPYRSWDEAIEPLIVRQFGFVVSVSNEFIKGLISDNDDKIEYIEPKDFQIKDKQ